MCATESGRFTCPLTKASKWWADYTPGTLHPAQGEYGSKLKCIDHAWLHKTFSTNRVVLGWRATVKTSDSKGPALATELTSNNKQAFNKRTPAISQSFP